MSLHPQRGKAQRLLVQIDEGEAVEVFARLVFSADGAVLRVVVPPLVGAARFDHRQAAARRLVARLDAELARPHAPGLLAVQREAELLAALAEDVAEHEARLGPELARTLREKVA